MKTRLTRSTAWFSLSAWVVCAAMCRVGWAAQLAPSGRTEPPVSTTPKVPLTSAVRTSTPTGRGSSEEGAVADRLVLREGRIEAVDVPAQQLVVAGRRLQWQGGRVQVFTLPARAAASVLDLRPGQLIRFALEGKDGERADDSERRRIVLIYLESHP
jgi:hypothetical protein